MGIVFDCVVFPSLTFRVNSIFWVVLTTGLRNLIFEPLAEETEIFEGVTHEYVRLSLLVS